MSGAMVFIGTINNIPASFVYVSQIMMWYVSEKEKEKRFFAIFAGTKENIIQGLQFLKNKMVLILRYY